MRRTFAGLLVFWATIAHGAGGDSFTLENHSCGGEGNLANVQCLGRYLRWLDAELNRAYSGALSRLPMQDATDDRRNREQLRKSQRAWLKYKAENCVVEGAQEGGSNLWVSHFAAVCEERETRARIHFLRKITGS